MLVFDVEEGSIEAAVVLMQPKIFVGIDEICVSGRFIDSSFREPFSEEIMLKAKSPRVSGRKRGADHPGEIRLVIWLGEQQEPGIEVGLGGGWGATNSR